MPKQNYVLAGAAGLAFTIVAAGAVPSFAQDAERLETGALNYAQARPLPPAPSPADQAAYEAALDQHNQAQARYNAQLEDYRAKQRVYAQAQQNYNTRAQAYAAQSDAYQEEAAIYDSDRSAFDSTLPVNPPAVVVVPDANRTVVVVPESEGLTYPDGRAVLVELEAIEDPQNQIGNAPVVDPLGNKVGNFSHMTYQDDGIPKAVIDLDNGKMVVIHENHFRYDPAGAVVVADLTSEEMNSMPARF